MRGRELLTRLVLPVALAALSALDATAQGVAAQSRGETAGAAIDKAFVGTWRLARIELIGAEGQRMAAPAPPAVGSENPIGLMICDAAGRFGATIMQSGRQKYAAAEPSPSEAKAALAGYIAYFGTYTVHPTQSSVALRIQGSLNPSETGTDRRHAIQFSAGRLAMTLEDGANRRLRYVWERAPELAHLSPTHRRFIGFWQRTSTERRKATGALVSADRNRGAGVLIFSASGYMAVHSMQPGRKTFAAAQPTPEEAKAAIDTYGSAYFGPYTMYEDEHLEVTHQIGVIDPGRVGTYARRHYEFDPLRPADPESRRPKRSMVNRCRVSSPGSA